ncbi:hypothetical protein [Enterococcus avium]|uniref:hypothetical protein n=1 Tax=Enterococcus avium TaxID=33945 RepID=UPI002892739F|nr:hypothetical protein [Enterococcus avium]MDT2463948.1 hypothetical protein [Enterococcus avium]
MKMNLSKNNSVNGYIINSAELSLFCDMLKYYLVNHEKDINSEYDEFVEMIYSELQVWND